MNTVDNIVDNVTQSSLAIRVHDSLVNHSPISQFLVIEECLALGTEYHKCKWTLSWTHCGSSISQSLYYQQVQHIMRLENIPGTPPHP